ncbi:MAG: hypothetical protein E7490_07810 [Ruminococcaceae bacterium]|nr:hypothetical protein [Oscillospiraceae bacterium]
MNKKFKAIVAGTMAAATVATTAVALTASAATIRFNSTGNTFGYSTNNVINYKNLTYLGDNTITYSNVTNLKEGNVVLAINFEDPNEDYFSDYDIMDEYLEKLQLKNSSGNSIVGNSYALKVKGGLFDEELVTVVPTRDVTNKIDITSAKITPVWEASANSYSTSTAWLEVNYKINGSHILVDKNDFSSRYVAGEIKNDFNDFYSATDVTTGTWKMKVNLSDFKYSGTTYTINYKGVKVATVKTPKLPQVYNSYLRKYQDFVIYSDHFKSTLGCTVTNY